MWSRSSCKQVRRQLALGVGDDLTPDEQVLADRHVAVCPQCREFREGLLDSHTALKRAAVMKLAATSSTTSSSSRSSSSTLSSVGGDDSRQSKAGDVGPRPRALWSDVRSRLPQPEDRRRRGEYDLRNWAVAGLSLAVCIMLTLVLRTIPQNGVHPGLAGEAVEVERPVVPVMGAAKDAVSDAMKGGRRPIPNEVRRGVPPQPVE